MAGNVGADMQFWAVEVPPGKKAKVEMNVESDDEIQAMELLHITNMALGEEPKEGARYTVSVACEGSSGAIPVGTLLAGKIEQAQLDLIFSDELLIFHSGPTSVFLSGYRSVSYALPSDIEDDSDDEFDGEDDSSEDEDQAPELVPANGIAPRQVQYAEAKVSQGEQDGDEDDSSEEDKDESGDNESEDEDDDADILRARSALKKAKEQYGAGDEDSDEPDEDGEEEEEDSDAVDAAMGEEDDDDDSEEDDSEEGDSEEEDSSDEDEDEPETKTPIKETPGKKRVGATPAVTPTPKKAKAEPATPAKSGKTPAKTPGGTPSGGVAKEYVASLVAFLKTFGKPATMSELGSKVKKPAGLPKLKEFLLSHKGQFKINPDTSVELV